MHHQVAVIHYHLDRGGVTQVIRQHLRGLASLPDCGGVSRVIVFHGGRASGWTDLDWSETRPLEVSLVTVAELGYDDGATAAPERLATQLLHDLQSRGMSPSGTVVHVHNHALGKNLSLPGAVSILAREGFPLLLQLHDFAEDFRPDNHRALVQGLTPHAPEKLPTALYPQSSSIHYAVLNGRDRELLRAAGIDDSRLHLLPNPVADIDRLPERAATRRLLDVHWAIPTNDRYVLYPVRGIRRKNLGELLLWSAVQCESTSYGTTLSPVSPAEQVSYRLWRSLAAELGLPVRFEVGETGPLTYAQHLSAADWAITTSVAEGFGMVFLEPWVSGLPLAGRNLPEITADFVAAGLQLDTLSDGVLVPVDWIGRDALVSDLHESYTRVVQAYGRSSPSRVEVERALSARFELGLLDFACCSARLQASIISQVAHDAGRRAKLLTLNPTWDLAQQDDREMLAQLVSRNAREVRKNYSLPASGGRLQRIYQSVLASPRHVPADLPHGSVILDTFLGLTRFHPIRTD